MVNKIKQILAREVLDSRGNPTIEVKVVLDNKISAKASIPSGASTGIHEALELRDKNPKRYLGKGVKKAVKNVNEKIAPLLKGGNVCNQKQIDKLLIKLDGTENKSKLGANAILGVSLACARAGALTKNKNLFEYIRTTYKLPLKQYKLPIPMMNIINGGQHATNSLDIQEFMIVPNGISNFVEKIRAGAETFHALKKILKENKYSTGVGDEGGYAPEFKKNEQAFEYILDAIKMANYRPKKQISIAIDAAASEFYSPEYKKYIFKAQNKKMTAEQLDVVYAEWIKKYPLISIEDGLDQDDWENWEKHTKKFSKKIMLVGDDLFVTNEKRLMRGIENKITNSILIKLNQIGTLTETIDTIMLAKKHNYKTIISHRSGETNDDFIADLSVAVNSEYIKTGSLSRSERLCKYNRLMEIELILKGEY